VKRIRSMLRFAVTLALLLGTAAIAPTIPTPAFADDADTDWQFVTQWKNDSGQDCVMYKDPSTKRVLVERWNDDGSVDVWVFGNTAHFKTGGDPNPDDSTSTGKGIEPVDVAGLIAKGLITYKIKATPENTPLAKWIDSEGGGMIPHYNPTDDDNKGPGRTPKGNNNEGGLTDKQKAEITKLINYTAKSLSEIGQSMGDVGGLSSESAPGLPANKNNRGKGTGGGNGADNNNGKRKYLGSDLSLGPRPDLVNPPHSKTDKSTVMTPGLLDGGSSFSTNGPSGVGTAIGKGGGTTSHGAGAAGIR